MCPNGGRILCLASVFALVTMAYTANDEDGHPGAKVSYFDSRLGAAYSISVKTPCDGEGLVARVDYA